MHACIALHDEVAVCAPCRLLGPTGMVGGVETSCHTRLHSIYTTQAAGRMNVQPSVITHSHTANTLLYVRACSD
jgi:hypothetical protein